MLVEAIEDLFVPVLVYNNKKGDDETILKQFKEPAWNNPVIRYLNSDGDDVIGRKENIWTTKGTAVRMIAALKASDARVPGYLNLVAGQRTKTQTAIFAMHCYWEGEANLGKIKGVRNTRSAWLQKKEVVEVEYDPAVVDYEMLIGQAQKMECASTIFATTDGQQKTAERLAKEKVIRLKEDEKIRVAKTSDQKYYLRNSNYRHLPLTIAQSTKINSLLMNRQVSHDRIRSLLSPRQLDLLKLISSAKKVSPKSLDAFVFPEDDLKLREYHLKLQTTAKKVAAR